MDIVTIHPTFVLGPVISRMGGDAPTVSIFKVRFGDRPCFTVLLV